MIIVRLRKLADNGRAQADQALGPLTNVVDIALLTGLRAEAVA